MFIDKDTSTTWLTPSDITSYLASPWLFSQRLLAQLGERKYWEKPDGTSDIAAARGEAHEQRYLEQHKDAGSNIAEIPRAKTVDEWNKAVALTAEAMRDDDFDVIFQAHLYSPDGRWRGQADFLERAGDGTWEPVDTKLARSVKPYMILQLSIYAAAMQVITGDLPKRFHLELGDGHRESFPTSDYVDYTQSAQARLERWYDSGEFRDEYPWPCEALADSGLEDEAKAVWAADDHLIQVANITKKQIQRLTEAGITTMGELANAKESDRPTNIAAATFERLRNQAELQKRAEPGWRFLNPEPNRGFALMPTRNRGDLFYDIEGDPLWDDDGGLEYLHGIWWHDYKEDAGKFKAIWAHDRAEEKAAFEELMAFFIERRTKHPNMRIYHYAPYETVALKRLAQTYGVCEAELDVLLKEHVFVDLFQVTRQALQASVPNYSIKSMERFYMEEREDAIKEAGGSIVAYERFREIAGTPEGQQLLDDIRDYNEVDCESTFLLREWLWARREEAIVQFGHVYEDETPGPLSEDRANASPMAAEKKPRELRRDRELALRERLKARAAKTDDPERARVLELASELLAFVAREERAGGWRYYELLGMSNDEVVADSIALGGLELLDEPDETSALRRFNFPPQDYKMRAGDQLKDPVGERSVGTLRSIDPESQTIEIKLNATGLADPPESVFPSLFIDKGSIEDSLIDLAESLDRDAGGVARFAAVERLLARELPLHGDSLQRTEIEDLCELLVQLRGSYLVAQGPPGSGKTWTAARLIIDQIRRGNTVGITAQSHLAVDNLVREVENVANAENFPFSGIKKDGKKGDYVSPHGLVTSTSDNGAVDPDTYDLIAGTAWLFSRAELHEQLDTLFIDEAGQFSLAYTAACGTSAETLVMLGDPNQLPQVLQATHPAGSGASALEHVIGDDRTISRERGVFLEQTRRLGPEICRFISDSFYESRLTAHDVAMAHLPITGSALDFVEILHLGNSQCSSEEAELICADIPHYLAAGVPGSEIMIVTPYNAQVETIAELVREKFPDEPAIRVLTVDKCQGQEAEVVYYSMASSGGEDVARGLDFLFSANRFNVAISRAKRSAVLVCSPALLETECSRPEEMRLLNSFVRYARLAEDSPVATR